MVGGCSCDYHGKFDAGGRQVVVPNASPVLYRNKVLKVWLCFREIVGFNFPLVAL